MSYYYVAPTPRRPSLMVRLVRVLGLFAAIGIALAFVLPYVKNVLGDGATATTTRDPGQTSNARPGTPTAVLEDNRFYTVGGLSQQDCPAPPLVDATASSQRTYDERIFGCLVTAWEPLLGDAKFSVRSPELFVFSGSGDSPCGSFRPATGRILAFYCPANQTMYADVQQMAKAFDPQYHIVYALVLAHEYGHHLQNMAGILDAESRLAYRTPSKENELSRRTETQASCFGGMFTKSIEESYPITGTQQKALSFFAYRAFGDSEGAAEDERSHGTPKVQGEWIETGFNENDTAACNTYTVPASQVR